MNILAFDDHFCVYPKLYCSPISCKNIDTNWYCNQKSYESLKEKKQPIPRIKTKKIIFIGFLTFFFYLKIKILATTKEKQKRL